MFNFEAAEIFYVVPTIPKRRATKSFRDLMLFREMGGSVLVDVAPPFGAFKYCTFDTQLV